MRTWDEIPTDQRPAYMPCPSCKGPMAKHATECQKCSQQIRRGDRHYAWKGDAARDESKRSRVANQKVWGPCESCGADGIDRHHKDGNPGNNVPGNLQVLCRRCHMEIDGRLDHVRSMHPGIRPAKPCGTCGEPAKPLRGGRCAKCAEYLRRTGVERPSGYVQTTVGCELVAALKTEEAA